MDRIAKLGWSNCFTPQSWECTSNIKVVFCLCKQFHKCHRFCTSAPHLVSPNNLTVRGGTESCFNPLADAKNRHRKGKVVQSHAENQSGTWDQNLGFPAPSSRLSLHLMSSGVRQGPSWHREGLSVGRTEMCAVRSGGRRWWLSCCSHGSRRGPECCCCIRPGSCFGSGSRPGLLCPRAGRSAPAASLACKQTQHRPEMVMRNRGWQDVQEMPLCKQGNWEALYPRLPRARVWCPGARQAWGRSLGQVQSCVNNRASVSPYVKQR